ncbi:MULTISPECIES: type II toxin-antitoxin system VapC family toxin [Alphaproteobacteria]|uniref:Ribonuclease VapC n=2 Tax=Alphaproteobacteria TaxID=28211 RepID=A0A512HGU3_9HYPH|nr:MULTISPECIES: type II toxin-antitoxin system VapC family toxin [Alphaproteobacteria]GEO84673.1 ribonuclease VapC [Ciceribacter naphthalenivorans]GLR20706.1 ribonuclease VapC [Ciceribacter naphthalenivorans]GLT03562.1 ribonuclease VapC [Sphingomonas psychrolutea]
MIVLDTNVLSELLAPAPAPAVVAWLAAQPAASVFTTAVTEAEILYGLALLPEGRRRRALEAAVKPIFTEDLAGRVLAFDRDAAESYAAIAAHRRAIGRPISQFDAQIAAIAVSRGASVATRNVADFAETGAVIINPWDHRTFD